MDVEVDVDSIFGCIRPPNPRKHEDPACILFRMSKTRGVQKHGLQEPYVSQRVQVPNIQGLLLENHALNGFSGQNPHLILGT